MVFASNPCTTFQSGAGELAEFNSPGMFALHSTQEAIGCMFHVDFLVDYTGPIFTPQGQPPQNHGKAPPPHKKKNKENTPNKLRSTIHIYIYRERQRQQNKETHKKNTRKKKQGKNPQNKGTNKRKTRKKQHPKKTRKKKPRKGRSGYGITRVGGEGAFVILGITLFHTMTCICNLTWAEEV